MTDDRILYSVDRSWGNLRSNADGDLAVSDYTKLHLDRGDSTAKCSPRVFLNSLSGDMGAGSVAEIEADTKYARWICRRCVPKPKES